MRGGGQEEELGGVKGQSSGGKHGNVASWKAKEAMSGRKIQSAAPEWKSSSRD